ncbi:unnamed protein product [Rotaria sp. Silwood2]|nr:unnamed protein product [Rotaria sp. Silwood2]
MRQIPPVSPETEFIWICQTNADPWDSSQPAEWTPYPTEISSALEKAFKSGADYTFIGELYRIDFIELVQEYIENPNQQRPIRRHNLRASVQNNEEHEIETARRERLLFPLNMNAKNSTTVDTTYHGSKFIRDWFLAFTNGKLDVAFDVIFPALINGLKHEGRNEPENTIKGIICALNLVRDETTKDKESKKMKKLEHCCAKLYTKQCFLYRVVNTALRDDDRTKLDTLGPYCYLVYNCVGRHTNGDLSIRRRLLQILHPTESQSMIVYRGDHVSREKIEEYRQAAERKDKCFKWLPFVSTSLDRDVAERFGSNVLYIIELRRYLSNDLFAYLNKNTYIESEEEILLRPGARFRVIKVQFDDISGRRLIYIKIIPSYVSNLR